MTKRFPTPETGPTPASTVPYKLFACPVGCGRTERAGKVPFYSACPGCNQPAGPYVPVVDAPKPERKPLKDFNELHHLFGAELQEG